jgi:hypothetical protein
VEDNLLYWFIVFVLILLYLELPRYKKLLKLLAKPRVMKHKSEEDCPYCLKARSKGHLLHHFIDTIIGGRGTPAGCFARTRIHDFGIPLIWARM